MKKCYRCGKQKELRCFYKNSYNTSGLNSGCKECVKELQQIKVMQKMSQVSKDARIIQRLAKDNPTVKRIKEMREQGMNTLLISQTLNLDLRAVNMIYIKVAKNI